MPVRKNVDTEPSERLSLTTALRDCLACGVLVMDQRGRIASCTPEALRLLGLTPGKAAQASASVLPNSLRKIIREVASTAQPATNRSVSLKPRGGSPALLQASVVPAGAGDSRKTVVVLHDIGIARRLEDNLSRLDRLASIGTLSASLGHEIKNALVAVKTFVDLLLEKSHDGELTEVVRRELRRIDSITGQMLKFAGPGRPAFSAVRLHDVLDHSLRMVQHQLEDKLISLHRSFQAAPDCIKGDDYQLEQAFVNLFLNAVEAMGANGSLKVATEIIPAVPSRPGHRPRLRVIVADSGIGIAPENMSHLFEPFFTTKNHGTGLGLPIAQRIIQEHHGDITVESEVNKGTTFSILLPAGANAH